MTSTISRRHLCLGLAGSAGSVQAGATVARTASGYTDPRKVLLWESTRKEVRELLEAGQLKAMIVPTASTEQHNEHLAMIHDTASVTLVAQQAALRLYPRVMVTTPVAIGISPHWMDRKGTLSLRKETFLNVVYDVCESLKTHGVKNILILNGHGGNEAPLRGAIPEFRSKLGVNLQFNSYWAAYTPEIVRKYMESGVVPGHSAEFETSFAMAAFPEHIHWEGVDYEKVKPHLGIKDPESRRQDEQFARGAKLATTAKGEAMIAVAVEWTAARLERMIAEG